MITPDIILVALFAAALTAAAFFAASETALIALGRLELERLRSARIPGAESVERLKRHPSRLLSTALLGQNLATSAASAVATILAQRYLGQGAALAVAVMASTVVLFAFGEMGPKSAAAAAPARVALAVARPFEAVAVLLRPAAASVQAVVGTLLRAIGISNSRTLMTEDEVRAAINIGRAEGAIPEDIHGLLTRVLEFGDRRVSEIMVPRQKIVALPELASFAEVRRVLTESKYSRLPVYRDTLDNIVGILKAKDLYDLTDAEEQSFRLASRMSPPFLVPEFKRAEELFREMRRRKEHMSIAVDEYGGTAGLVTIEDVIESLLGAIQDEYDEERPKIRRIDDRTFLLDGTLRLEELDRAFHLSYPGADAETVAGLLLQRFGRIPKNGDRLRGRQAEYVVVEATPTAIRAVKMILPARTPDAHSE